MEPSPNERLVEKLLALMYNKQQRSGGDGGGGQQYRRGNQEVVVVHVLDSAFCHQLSSCEQEPPSG